VGTAYDNGTREEEITTSSNKHNEGEGDSDLKSIYQSILDNKSKQKVELPDESTADDRPDPGFRIYHVDKETGEETEVPPYTSPGVFLESLKRKKSNVVSSSSLNGDSAQNENESVDTPGEYDETTFDGYQAILEANSSTNREDELKAMREARKQNRLGQTGIEYGTS